MSSHEILDRSEGRQMQIAGRDRQAPAPDRGDLERTPHQSVTWVLSQMTFQERVRAYELGTFTRRELCAAAGREPESVPLLNGEFEWVAVFSADLD